MELQRKQRLTSLSTIAILFSSIPFAQSELLGVRSNEELSQQQWLHQSADQGQGIWQLQNVDKIHPELSRMPSRKDRVESMNHQQQLAQIQNEETEYHGAPKAQLLQLDQSQEFLGEPVRWIKCAFIDCDAQEAYKKKVQEKVDVEKKVKQDVIDVRNRKEHEETEVRQKKIREDKEEDERQRQKRTVVKTTTIETTTRWVEEKKEEPKKEEKKEEKKVIKKEDKKEEKKEEKKKEEPKVEKKKEEPKKEDKKEEKTKKESGSAYDDLFNPKKEDPTKADTSGLGALGSLFGGAAQISQEIQDRDNEQDFDQNEEILASNQDMMQLGSKSKSNLQISMGDNIRNSNMKKTQNTYHYL